MLLQKPFKTNIFYFIKDLEFCFRFTDLYKKGYALSTINDYLIYLKERELIIQINFPNNKREKSIQLTEKGKKLLKLIKEIDIMLSVVKTQEVKQNGREKADRKAV